MNNSIEIKNLNKIFKDNQGIKNISINILKGSFHGIFGLNGAGKTTLVNVLTYLTKKYEGIVKIYGTIGYVPAENNFPPLLNVKNYFKNIITMLGFENANAFKELKKIFQELSFDYEHFKNKKIKKMSSGQKKKILLAQCLLSKSDILIMDEPTANLDPISRENLLNFLKKQNIKGKTIIVISHNLTEIESYLKNITVIHKSKVMYHGNVKKFKNNKNLLKSFTKFVNDRGEDNYA